MYNKIFVLFLFSTLFALTDAQIPVALKKFLGNNDLTGASVSLQVRDCRNGEIIHAYDQDREMIPASVMKLVSTATALEVLGEDYHFETSIEYSGEIKDGVLNGNIYIKGSGDPTLGSSHIVPEGTKQTWNAQNKFISQWVDAIKSAGIHRINGSIIGDESIFDTEGISHKWLLEDLGSYYGAGSYGISVFDNIYRLYIKTGNPDTRPVIIKTQPEVPSLYFHNYLTVSSAVIDSSYILGFPFSNERFLYGTVPSGKESLTLRGDIPDPSYLLAHLLTNALKSNEVEVKDMPTTTRIQPSYKKRNSVEIVTTTLSPPLMEIISIINKKSHNLYADAVLKRVGLEYKTERGEVLSSFGKGTRFVETYWQNKGFNTSSLHLFDGSGLAPTDKLSTGFICDLLLYMRNESTQGDTFYLSLPLAGVEGSVRNFLKDSALEANARIKSGSMSRVKGYAGYITKDDREYAFAILVNNYNGEGRQMTKEIEKLLLTLF